jgi:hypothetical protein
MLRKPALLIACLAVAGLIAVPGIAAAKSGARGGGLVGTLATGACTSEKQAIGKRAFRKRYGRKQPARACVKRNRADARRAVTAATAQCQDEFDEYGEEEFYLEWEIFSDCLADYAAWIMDGGGFEEGDSEDEGDEEEGFELPLI